MGLMQLFGGSDDSKKQQDWAEQQANSSDNSFAMSDPNLKGMAVADVKKIAVLEPIAKLTETEVELTEKEAQDWREQEQLHGRLEAAKTSKFVSHANISQGQFTQGQKRIKAGLSSRDKGATKFGEFMFSRARPEFASQNYRVKLAKDSGEHTIRQMGQQYDRASAQYNDYVEEM